MSDRRSSDGLVGIKVDECPACQQTCAHRIEASGRKGRSGGRLVCSNCGSAEPLRPEQVRVAGETRRLSLPRPRPSFAQITSPSSISAGAAAKPPDAIADPDAWVSAQLARARTDLARGANPGLVAGNLYDLVGLAHWDGSPRGRRLALPVLLGGALVLALVIVGASMLFLRDDDASSTTGGQASVIGSPSPGSSPVDLLVTRTPTVSVPPPTMSSTPDPQPNPTITPEPVRPTPQDGANKFANSDLSALAARVPDAIVATCVPNGETTHAGVIGAFACTVPSPAPMSIQYTLFRGPARARDAFAAELPELRRSSAGCLGEERVRESDYHRESLGAAIGQRVCAIRADGTAVLLWTHLPNRMMVRADFDADDLATVTQLWTDQALWPCEVDLCVVEENP